MKHDKVLSQTLTELTGRLPLQQAGKYKKLPI
jgi:hypothetical protein